MTDNEREVNLALAKEPLIVKLRPSDRTKEFTNFSSYERFLAGELRFWKQTIEARPNPGVNSFQALINANNLIVEARGYIESNVHQALVSTRRSLGSLEPFRLFSETPEGRFVLSQAAINGERLHGALYYFQPDVYGASVNSFSSEVLKGFLDTHNLVRGKPKEWAELVTESTKNQQERIDEVFQDIQSRYSGSDVMSSL